MFGSNKITLSTEIYMQPIHYCMLFLGFQMGFEGCRVARLRVRARPLQNARVRAQPLWTSQRNTGFLKIFWSKKKQFVLDTQTQRIWSRQSRSTCVNEEKIIVREIGVYWYLFSNHYSLRETPISLSLPLTPAVNAPRAARASAPASVPSPRSALALP